MFYEPFIEFPLKSLYAIIALIGKKKMKNEIQNKKNRAMERNIHFY